MYKPAIKREDNCVYSPTKRNTWKAVLYHKWK